jgi:acyl dehydratase
MNSFESVDDLATKIGEVLGISDWVTITQEQVNMFADATGDHQWIHVDPERAAASPFGTTIAHGLMTLALVPGLTPQMFHVKGVDMILNYGLNKVRYPAPVPVGSRVRARVTLVSVDPVGSDGAWQAVLAANVEIEGGVKPAVVSEIVLRLIS